MTSRPLAGPELRAGHRITLADLRGRATISIPEAGQVLGIGRDASYRAADRGEIPTLTFGRRRVVPVHRLLELLGITDFALEHEIGADPHTGAGANVLSLTQEKNDASKDSPPPGA